MYYYCDVFDNDVDKKTECNECEHKRKGKHGICNHAWVSPLWEERCKAAEYIISKIMDGDDPDLEHWISLVKNMGDSFEDNGIIYEEEED